MSDNYLQFAIPEGTSLSDLRSKLPMDIEFSEEPSKTLERTYYDSFDWRLYNQGWVLEQESVAKESQLSWRSLDSGELYLTLRNVATPGFAWDLPVGVLRDKLEPILEMRTLLPRVKVRSTMHTLRMLNDDQKTVLRLVLEENRVPEAENTAAWKLDRVRVLPVKGYSKPQQRMLQVLTEDLGLAPVEDLMLAALTALGQQPGDYSSKITLELDPQGRAVTATKNILRTLLSTMELNEAGTLADLDSEFLHDFRVAVRRTRSALSQIKGVIPAEPLAYFQQEFAWLGQLTGPTRDMDVYLLKFDDYRNSLPESVSNDLEPLHEFLYAQQKKEQQALAKALKSARYRKLIKAWRTFLEAPLPRAVALPPNASRSTKEVADERIWKVYRRVLKEGRAIGPETPAEFLHDLRKTCKKLRYLIEFFQSLYPEAEIKTLIKVLKILQENLGDFQDFEVQVSNLKHFGQQMLEQGLTAAEAIMAMGILVQGLEQRQHQTRKEFADRFAEFQQAENRRLFKALFAPQPKPEATE